MESNDNYVIMVTSVGILGRYLLSVCDIFKSLYQYFKIS